MPIVQATTPDHFLSNTGASLPKYSPIFQHDLGRIGQQLASVTRLFASQKRLGLTEHNTDSEPISEDRLRQIFQRSQLALRDAFQSQINARSGLLQQRQALIHAISNNTGERGILLESFKVKRHVLEAQKTLSSEEQCCTLENNEPTDRDKTSGCGHEESSGVVIDLDEAAHGAFASSKHLSDVSKGKPEAVAESFKNEAAEMTAHPIQHLGAQLTHGGVTDFATAVSAGGVMLPLAALAVKAGIEEWKHSQHELKENERSMATEKKLLDRMTLTAAANESKQFNALVQTQAIRVEKLKEHRALLKNDRGIGAMSAASGLSIGIKALSDIGLKVSLGVKGALTGKGFFALGESARTGTAAAGAAVGFGIAGTFVLGPLAGAFATALGGFFTVKTIRKLSQLKSDFGHLSTDLKADALSRNTASMADANRLHEFLHRQGKKRIGFFSRFGRWNKAFMVGSGLYASSAITKAAVVGIAASGLAAAAINPVGLAVISTVGVVGAIAMGVTSFSFLRGHEKQAKYSSVTSAGHDMVDRKLLTNLYTFQTTTPQEDDASFSRSQETMHLGFDMANACLKNLDVQKAGLRDFLREHSSAERKHSPLEKNLSWWKHLKRQVISERSIARYLQTTTGHSALRKLTVNSLRASIDMLETKLKSRTAWINVFARTEVNDANTNSSGSNKQLALQQVNALADTYAQLEADYAMDQTQLELAILQLKKVESTSDMPVEALGAIIKAGDTTKEISKHLRFGMDREIRTARGVLFESQLEGARLRDTLYRAKREAKETKLPNTTPTAHQSDNQG